MEDDVQCREEGWGHCWETNNTPINKRIRESMQVIGSPNGINRVEGREMGVDGVVGGDVGRQGSQFHKNERTRRALKGNL